MTEELITTADKDRSVSNADRLLTPGSDKAGGLGKAALLPAPDGVPLLEAGAGSDERKPRLLRRIGGYVAGLASRLAERTGWRSTDEGYEATDNASGDPENEDSHEEEELDELTLRRIDRIEKEWEFRANVDGFNGNFIPRSYPDFAGSIASGNYEEIEKLVPDVRKLVANNDRLNRESENYDKEYTHSFLLDLAKDNVAAFFRKHYKYMPKLADSARRAMQEQIDSTHSLKYSDSGDFFNRYYRHEEAVIHLMSAEAALPREIAEEFKDGIVNEVAEVVEAAANSVGWRGFDANAAWLADHGFPPERWPQDARDREDFPEPLRRLVNERGDKEKGLDRAIIKYCIEKTELYDGDSSKMKPDVYGRCNLIQKYFEGRLPELDRDMIFCGVSSMVTSYSSKSMYLQTERYNDYIRTIRGIGQENANKLGEELGITHFSDWSPEVLRGTLHILETGRTESGNPATIIIRGDSGDHNGSAYKYHNIKSTDMFAVEISHTDMLSGIVEKLESAGVDSSTFYSVILFGHGDEDAFTMSYGEKIPPDSQEWYNKKGLRDLVTALAIDTIVLNSCHPLVREKGKFVPLTLSEGFQRREGTAPAISKAFPWIRVISGLDGIVYSLADETGYINMETTDKGGVNGTYTMAETWNGWTHVYEKGADRQ